MFASEACIHTVRAHLSPCMHNQLNVIETDTENVLLSCDVTTIVLVQHLNILPEITKYLQLNMIYITWSKQLTCLYHSY